MTASETFSRIFTPVTKEVFLEQYLNKRPLHLHRQRNIYQDLFDEERFYQSLANCERVRAVFGGLKQAAIAPVGARDMLEVGATICATQVERADSILNEVVKALKRETGYTGFLSCNAYLSPEGAGFAPHYDPRTVTTLQIAGSKKWFYCPQPYEEYPQQNSPIPAPLSFKEHVASHGTEAIVLSPGDLLCLPPGVIHWAEATGGQCLSLNLAFDYLFDSLADNLTQFMQRTMAKQALGRKAVSRPLRQEDVIELKATIDYAVQILIQLKGRPEELYDEYGE